jgi:replicative DNA helicase
MTDKAKAQRLKTINAPEGLVPPQATDLEEAVLGACLLEREAVSSVIDILTADCFYKEQNGIVYSAILDLYKNSKPIDILTITQKIKADGKLEVVGGAYYITSLTNRIASSANIEYHARIVMEHFLKRELIRIGIESIKEAYDTQSDVFDVYQNNVQHLEQTLTSVMKYDVSSVAQIHNELLAESIKVVQSGVKSGVPTGFRNLDNFTNGWQKSDLIIVAGRPGMGKSVCALAFALNPAIQENIPTAIFSLEMSKEQVVGRAQSNLSGIGSSNIVKKLLTMEDIRTIDARCQGLNTAPIYIDDTPALSVMELKGKARKLVRDKGVRLIVIDYLQLMVADVGKGNREQEISKISQGLKALAKELNIPIIALAQLSRAVEARGGDKKPLLSDLRESGSIEQDADMVLFTYRPEYYTIDSYELNGETMNTEGLMCLIVAKHRAGSLGELRFGFNGDLTKLENYDTYMENKRNTQYAQPPNNAPTTNMAENTGFLSETNVANNTTNDVVGNPFEDDGDAF